MFSSFSVVTLACLYVSLKKCSFAVELIIYSVCNVSSECNCYCDTTLTMKLEIP